MPLLMIDLDNTLVDRDAAFRAAATAFLAEHDLPDGDLDWLMTLDASGYTPRREVARALSVRYGGIDSQDFLDRGAADRITLSDPVREALMEARADGWSCVIVTNGRTVQQETKIRNVGLDRLVHGWVISEAAGHRKPEPEIFHAAAAVAGAALDGSWMIGDSAPADIRGALGVGARSVWVSAGRPWTEPDYRPTLTTPDTASAIRRVSGGRDTTP
ncbi:HAD family hydrolase [Streptomyces sp. NPDC102476]|jgi:putative hydrolase of the HAD superfamily|uniref:HAD family hydrolase n=1 Tax=Streptomyces sp. NPDC102476 TaxID=3366181 RepID=UPI00380F7EA1